jgi:hypothetical protein
MSSESVFNLSRPARANAEFVFVDEAGDSISWNAHPSLAPGIRNRLIEAVRRVPEAWLLPPQEGEVFDTAEEGQQRVLDYSLAAGFQSVGGQGSRAGRKNIWCIHHGDETRNDRKLEHKVQKDYNGKIISNRKREDTGVWAKACPRRCYLVTCKAIDSESGVLNR